MRNLNIKDDETYELAQFIANRTGKSLKLVVRDALKKEKRELTKDELIEKWMKRTDEIAARLTPEQRSRDYQAEMYDEDGLPIW